MRSGLSQESERVLETSFMTSGWCYEKDWNDLNFPVQLPVSQLRRREIFVLIIIFSDADLDNLQGHIILLTPASN